MSGKVAYRLRQVDHDGQSAYSDVIVLQTLMGRSIRAWSAPGSSVLTVDIAANSSGVYQLHLYDVSGRMVHREQIRGGRTVLPLSGGLSSGIYMVRILEDDQPVFTTRILK